MNLMGFLNLETMSVTIDAYETLNSIAMNQHFQKIYQKYPKAQKIHLILDQGPYNISQETKEVAKTYGIVLNFLLPYSSNLNPIERLWKIMNEHVRDNSFLYRRKNLRKPLYIFLELHRQFQILKRYLQFKDI